MKVSNSKLIKRVFQILFFLYVFSIVLLKYLNDIGVQIPINSVDLHAICPFGAVESLGRLFLVDKFIPKIHESNFWILLGSISGTILFGALFCGWLCPLGSIQDLFYNLGQKVLKKRLNVPKKLDKLLGYFRYIILFLIIIQTTKHLSLVFTKVDPYYALFHFWTGEALPLSIVILSIVLLISLFINRPWCRWFCPFGVIQGLIHLISPWKIRRNIDSCINCNKCTKACSFNIDVAKIDSVKDTRCNKCLDCIDVCPVNETLEYRTLINKGLPLKNKLIIGLILVVLFFTPTIIAKQFGLFKTSNKIVVMTKTLNAEDLKGSMTISDLIKGFGITKVELYNYLELSDEIEIDEKLRNIEDFNESLTLPSIRDKMMLWH